MRKRLALALMMTAMGPVMAGSTPIGDGELVAKVDALFASTGTPADRILGTHQGLLVIIDVRCAGNCPADTLRIVHYTGTADQACKQTDGIPVNIVVPRGIGAGPEKFCIPRVLANRRTYADKPFQN